MGVVYIVSGVLNCSESYLGSFPNRVFGAIPLVFILRERAEMGMTANIFNNLELGLGYSSSCAGCFFE